MLNGYASQTTDVRRVIDEMLADRMDLEDIALRLHKGDEAKQKVEELEVRVSELEGERDDARNELEDLKSELEDLQSQLADLEAAEEAGSV